MDTSLCSNCSALPARLFQPSQYSHDISLGDRVLTTLKASANQGCKLCVLLADAIQGESTRPDQVPNGKILKLQALCKRKGEIEYHTLDSEPAHTKLLAVWIGGTKVCHLRFDFGSAEPIKPGKEVVKRELQQKADHPSNFDLISNWLDICTKQHNDCTMNLVSDLTLPARLIDVRPEEEGVDVKLVVTANQNQQLRPGYAVLSHCWGPNTGGMLKATKANLGELQKGINWESLSKTFQDAIEITRKLKIRGKGIRHLWIDSLCILQDDPKDFEREGTAMHKIYSMATCTIAASSSSSGQGGCLIPRDDKSPEQLQPCHLTINNEPITIYPWSTEWSNAHRGPLSTRGWCFQERELSRRTLHFTTHRIFWECRTAIASEDHPSMINVQSLHSSSRPHGADPDRLLVLMELGVRSFMPLSHTRPLATKLWCRAVQEYTRRNLTFRKDRLPAIYGIARIISAVIRDDYVAGIWLCDFARGASWVRDRSLPNPNAVAGGQWPVARADPSLPSWSWAAIDGPVLYPGLENFDVGGYLDGSGGPANLHQLSGGAFSFAEYDRNGSLVHRSPLSGLSATYQKGLLRNYALEVLGLSGEEGNFGAVENSELTVRGVGIDIMISESDCFPSTSTANNPLEPKCYAMFGRSIFRLGSASKPNVEKGVVYFDDDPRQLMKQPFVCLRLGERREDIVQGGKLYVGLVLQSVVRIDGFTREQLYRRVGTWLVGSGNKYYNKHVKLGEFVLV
ncbi:heterokaryon incompatibility protein-domain-containing protein [Cadophora sp. MPI-SDFR-AT-0126]|nr:heterokaryon incompatibility protein-domain-containing protein [Leotiomycetes sp. MPI-SDFR-AT-0126]